MTNTHTESKHTESKHPEPKHPEPKAEPKAKKEHKKKTSLTSEEQAELLELLGSIEGTPADSSGQNFHLTVPAKTYERIQIILGRKEEEEEVVANS